MSRRSTPDRSSRRPATKAKQSPKQSPRQRSTQQAKPTTASIADERARAQEEARRRRAENERRIAEHFATAPRGTWIVKASWISTVVFVVPTVVATVTNTTGIRHFAAYVSLVLFLAGMVVFPIALWIGAQRSRVDDMTMAGWWFLTGSAPADVRNHLWASLGTQIAVSLTCAAFRFETSIAFGVLVPILGLAFLGLWGGRYGWFPRREFAQRDPLS